MSAPESREGIRADEKKKRLATQFLLLGIAERIEGIATKDSYLCAQTRRIPHFAIRKLHGLTPKFWGVIYISCHLIHSGAVSRLVNHVWLVNINPTRNSDNKIVYSLLIISEKY